jgi:Carboxypeptidase regulatory-like domain/TonB-dependent Receptor Plug Domain/TonB dependent receptor
MRVTSRPNADLYSDPESPTHQGAQAMTRNLFRSFSKIPALLVFLAAIVPAQAPGTGAIEGTVFDPAGRVLAKADITIENEATHVTRSVITNASGTFNAPLLLPGSYSMVVRVEGFEEKDARAVPVVVSETSTVEFHLALAQVGQTVEVAADTEMAQTQSSALGRALDQQAIAALPLANRNYTQILSLSPGVVVALPDATVLGRGTQDVTANGQKTTANNIQFNGVDANNLSQNSAMADGEEVGVAVPAPDTIQEFKVQTGNYDATYGRGTGANVDVISRTGADSFHGNVWEFLRNDDLNANGFFSKLTGQPRPVLKQNQFGASVGGPIWRGRTFFFGAYQGLRSSNGEGDEVSATLPQLTGDRSAATLGAQFCAYPTYAGGTQVACDGSNINPVALALLNFKLANGQYAIPDPQINLPSEPGQVPIGESIYATPATYREDQYTANLDHSASQRNELSARFFYSRAPTIEPFSPNAANVPGWGTNEVDQNAMLVLSDTHAVNARLVNSARFGYMRFSGISSVQNPILASELGTNSPAGTSGSAVPAPGITVDGLFTIGDAGTPFQQQTTNSFIWQDTASLTRGRQSIRTGAEAKRHQVMVNAPFSTSGLLDIRTFDDFLLGQSAAQNASPDGISNVTMSGGSSGDFRKDERYTDVAAFYQDDIKLTSRLTINAGLRYEIFSPPTEIHGRLVNFDPAVASLTAPSTGTLSGFIVASNFQGPVPPGVTQTSRSGLWPVAYNNLSPRFGFAYRLTERPIVVLRGGYGIYFDRLSGGLAESLLSNPPFSVSQLFAGAENAGATLAQPFSPVLPSDSSYPIFIPRIPGGGPTVVGMSSRFTEPYTEEYNLNTQVQFAHDYLLELGYVGTRAVHVAGCGEFNQALLASSAVPVYGQTVNSISNVVERAPYQGVAPGSYSCSSSFNSNYNSLQTSITKRLSRGFQFLGSYTFSRNLDETSGSSGSQVFELWLLTNDQHNPRQAYGPTDFDRTQRGVFSLTYNTPSLSNVPRLMRDAVAGWQASGIFVAQSGTPVTILDDNAGAVYGNYPFENRAQLAGLVGPTTSGSLHSRVLSQYLNPAAFTSAPEAPNGTSPADTDFGNSGTGLVRGPGQRNIDLALERVIPVVESQSIRFRAEFFNLTNTPNFANPNNTVSSGAAFGIITATSNNPRIIQLALKYQF